MVNWAYDRTSLSPQRISTHTKPDRHPASVLLKTLEWSSISVSLPPKYYSYCCCLELGSPSLSREREMCGFSMISELFYNYGSFWHKILAVASFVLSGLVHSRTCTSLGIIIILGMRETLYLVLRLAPSDGC